jgi:HK97 family phage portal protein
MPVLVHEGERHGTSVPAPKAPQWRLLGAKPNDQGSAFDFYAFLVASLQGYGGAAALKAKGRRGVEALYPMDPRRYTPRVEGGELVLRVQKQDSAGFETLTRDDVLYIPGVLWNDPLIGVSPITMHANAIGSALATEEYAGRFYENDATPGGILEMPFNSDSQQAKDMRELWEDRHRGGRNHHKTAVAFGGATYKTIGVNAADAQIVEAQQWGVHQMARCFRLPGWILDAQEGPSRMTSEDRRTELLIFSILPWTMRIEQALEADSDLFPDGSGLFPATLTDSLLRADTKTRYQAYLQGRQAGWLSANDIRAKENEPPIDGGDEYQTTPVGGAPNLQPGGAAADPNQEAA